MSILFDSFAYLDSRIGCSIPNSCNNLDYYHDINLYYNFFEILSILLI